MEPIRLGGIKTGLLFYLAEQSINQPNNSMQCRVNVQFHGSACFENMSFKIKNFPSRLNLILTNVKSSLVSLLFVYRPVRMLILLSVCLPVCPYVFCLSVCFHAELSCEMTRTIRGMVARGWLNLMVRVRSGLLLAQAS